MAEVGKITVKIGANTYELEKGLKKSTKETTKFSKHIKKIGGIIAGAFAVREVAQFTTQSIKLAGEMEGIARKFNTLGVSIQELRSSVKGTVSDMELMAQTNAAANLGLDVKQLGTLFEFATIRASETGESVANLVKSISLGLGRRSIMILDNLGITTAQLSKELNGASIQAVSMTKLMEAVGNIAKRSIEEAGDATLTTAQKLQKLNAQWTNFKVRIGEAIASSEVFSNALETIVGWTEKLLGVNSKADKAVGDFLNTLSRTAKTENEWIAAVNVEMDKLSKANLEYFDMQQDTRKGGVAWREIQSYIDDVIYKYELLLEARKEWDRYKPKSPPPRDTDMGVDNINKSKDALLQAHEIIGGELVEINRQTEGATGDILKWIEDDRRESLKNGLDMTAGYLNDMSGVFSDYYANQLAAANLTEEEREKLLRKQAIAEKLTAATSIGVNTASAIIKAVEASPLTAGMPWTAIIGALGAAQLATVMGTPIPSFAEGGIVTSPTLAMIGDNPSRKEAVIPLDRYSGMGGNFQFVIKGKDLVAIQDIYNSNLNSYK